MTGWQSTAVESLPPIMAPRPKGTGTPQKATPEAKAAAVRVYGETGSKGAAIQVLGVSQSYFYQLLRADEDFADAMKTAHANYIATLEEEAHRRAVEGWDEDRMGAGGIVYQVRKFSDALLLHLLKKNDPEKHGDKLTVDQTVARKVSAKDLGLDNLTDEEARQLLGLLGKAQGDGDQDDGQ